jgi:hypothetical protein
MYSDGSTSLTLACEAFLRFHDSSHLDGGAVAGRCATIRVPSAAAPPETNSTPKATSSITLLPVPKLALPLSIRAYSEHYAELYSWK